MKNSYLKLLSLFVTLTVFLVFVSAAKVEIQEIINSEEIKSIWKYNDGNCANYHPDAEENEFFEFYEDQGYIVETLDDAKVEYIISEAQYESRRPTFLFNITEEIPK